VFRANAVGLKEHCYTTSRNCFPVTPFTPWPVFPRAQKLREMFRSNVGVALLGNFIEYLANVREQQNTMRSILIALRCDA
jgi:hypothetical protein